MITNNTKQPSFSTWSEYDEEEEEPFRTRIQRRGIGIIEMEYYDNETIMYCPMCKKAGFEVKLGPKIIMPGEVRQPDYENWLQCPDCYEVIAAYVVEHDATIIRDDIETVETPFENTSEIIGANARRTTAQGKKASAKRRKERYRAHDDDKEIDALLRIYGDRANVLK